MTSLIQSTHCFFPSSVNGKVLSVFLLSSVRSKIYGPGWMNGMRFLIKREEPVLKEATEDTPEEKGEPIFHAWIWPGPYIFDLTDNSKKTDNTFPFTDDGKKQCVDWINEVISAHSNEYPKNKTDGENL